MQWQISPLSGTDCKTRPWFSVVQFQKSTLGLRELLLFPSADYKNSLIGPNTVMNGLTPLHGSRSSV